MIQHLRGKKIFNEDHVCVIDVQGVGYEIQVSAFSAEDFANANEVAAWVYTAVKEDSIQLFGFSTRLEREFFVALMKVNGLGPKSALHVLSTVRPAKLAQLIESKDVAGLSALPKIGKKTAEQMILTLKGKLPTLQSGSVTGHFAPLGAKQEVHSALINLGFRLGDVESFIENLPSDVTVEQGVRAGLSALANEKGG